MAEDLFAACVGVNGVPLEPVEVFAALADVLAPSSLHVQKSGFVFTGEIFQILAIVAVVIGIAYSLPLSFIARIDSSEGARHQEDVCFRAFSDLADDIPDRADIALLADAADNDKVRIMIEDEFLNTAGLLIPPAAG